MSKKSLPIVFPLVILLIASLACSRLTGGAASGPQATLDAAYTEAAASAATANAALTQAVGGGDSAVATANAAATEAIATTNAATGGNTTDATATPAADQPTAAATAGDNSSNATGGPKDIPLVDGKNTVELATDNLLTYVSSADIATVTNFYKDAMPKSGWAPIAVLTVETPNANTLGFSKDNRTATVIIGGANGQTIVTISVK